MDLSVAWQFSETLSYARAKIGTTVTFNRPTNAFSLNQRRRRLPMEYTNLGTAGVKVSQIALGLGLRGQAGESVAQRLVEHAIEQGITFIDCANIYGPMDDRDNIGRSEVVVGKALAGLPGDLDCRQHRISFV